MLKQSMQQNFSGDAGRMIDIASARLWLEEGFPVADVLTMLEVRRRFELCARDGRAYAVEILWAAQDELRSEKDSSIHTQKETHHATA